jgi:3-hydroxyisobutyrate dehydrogenase-like beta-hydroxyacid dehydrogenase
MGSGVVKTLARHRFPLHLYDLIPERAQELAREVGATAWPSAAAAASAADVCISLVPDDQAVEALYRGPEGMIAGIRPGAVAAEMSTVMPSATVSLARAFRDRGASIVDAPVSGNPRAAAEGTMTAIMVGGPAEAFDKVRPVLSVLAKSVFHVGDLGSGAAMKLVHQLVIYGLNQAVSEALVMAELAGISPSNAYEVLMASAVGAPLLHIKREAFLQPDSTPVAFTLQLAEKDLRLIADFAHGVGAPTPQAALNLETVGKAKIELGPNADYASVAVYLRHLTSRRTAN